MEYNEKNIHNLKFKHKDGSPTIYWYDIFQKRVYWTNSERSKDGSTSLKIDSLLENINRKIWLPIKEEVNYEIY